MFKLVTITCPGKSDISINLDHIQYISHNSAYFNSSLGSHTVHFVGKDAYVVLNTAQLADLKAAALELTKMELDRSNG